MLNIIDNFNVISIITSFLNAINVDPVKIRQSILLMKEKCSKSIDELNVYLNQLPEIIPRKTKLLEPIQIEHLQWEQLKSEMNLSWSTTRLYKRSLKNLIFKKAKVSKSNYFSEVLELYVIIQPTSIKSALAILLLLLFNITRSNISSLILSYNRLLDSYPVINMAGRPFILSNDQMEELLNIIMLKEKQYLPMSKTNILLYISENYDKQFTKK